MKALLKICIKLLNKWQTNFKICCSDLEIIFLLKNQHWLEILEKSNVFLSNCCNMSLRFCSIHCFLASVSQYFQGLKVSNECWKRFSILSCKKNSALRALAKLACNWSLSKNALRLFLASHQLKCFIDWPLGRVRTWTG